MSAYICNPETFGILASFAILNKCGISQWQLFRRETQIEDAQRIAIGLAKENIRSVAHRYPDDKDGQRPGPCLKDAEIEEAAAIYAAHFLENSRYVRSLSPVQIIKIVQCAEYQSCETDDWKETLACRQLDWIKDEAIRALPGYEAAEWGYERSIPEIEALYERSQA